MFSTSYSYTNLGKIEDATGLATALGNSSVRVTFDIITEKIKGESLNIKNIVKETSNRQANIELYNPNDEAVSGTLLVAIYDGRKLVEAKMSEETFPSEESSITVNFNTKIEPNYTVRAFVWKSIGNMQPLSNALEK